MFAIAFDLVVAETALHHPRGVSQAYAKRPTPLPTRRTETHKPCIKRFH